MTSRNSLRPTPPKKAKPPLPSNPSPTASPPKITTSLAPPAVHSRRPPPDPSYHHPDVSPLSPDPPISSTAPPTVSGAPPPSHPTIPPPNVPPLPSASAAPATTSAALTPASTAPTAPTAPTAQTAPPDHQLSRPNHPSHPHSNPTNDTANFRHIITSLATKLVESERINPSDPSTLEPISRSTHRPHTQLHPRLHTQPHTQQHTQPHTQQHTQPHTQQHTQPHTQPHALAHSTAAATTTPIGAAAAVAVAAAAATATAATTTATATRTTARDGRRVVNRRKLEDSGASPALLQALDSFTTAIPPIPNQVDHGRKTQNRDMRKWITLLQDPLRTPLWTSLVNTLRTDSSAETRLGDQWDRHLCHYILGVVVSENNASAHPEGRSQTRQAVNNAIKRELACPTESGKSRGKSARSKTFRELFREKCRAAGVSVPPLDDSLHPAATASAPGYPISSAPSSPPPLTLRPSIATLSSPRRSISPPQMLPVSPPCIKLRPSSEERHLAQDALNALRSSCPHTDEWGQTSWWQLDSDEYVHRLPSLLALCSMFELRSLLLDFRWIKRTFRCIDYSSGMRQIATEGYDWLLAAVKPHSESFSAAELEGYRLIRNAIMLILPILKEDDSAKSKPMSFYAHLATQLTGRLLELKRRFSNVACLVHSIEQHAPRPWLRPLSRCFQQPRTDIKLAVPSNGTFTPHLIKLSEDGKILVTSGSRSHKDVKGSVPGKVNMIRVWDVENGSCVLENREVPNFVRQLSLTRDKSCIIFETVDGLFFWHLSSGIYKTDIAREVAASPKTDDVTSITPMADATWVLTTHRRLESVALFGQHGSPAQDRAVISLWNTQHGQRHKAFSAVTSNANCIDVSSNGELFASGHDNGFIHLWNPQTAEAGPVLSFQNAGGKVGPQPVVPLDRANGSRDAGDRRTISISFHERDGAQWVAAVSEETIRVWQLPPGHLIPDRASRKSESNEYLATVCRAVIRRPRTRQVEWSQLGCLYSGGDDGMACEWERCSNGAWRWYSIDKNRGERMSEISASFISVAKRGGYVATYLTKSPYVVVWDMGKSGETERVRLRDSAYRSHCAMKGSSVDVTDIQDLTALRKTTVQGPPGVDGGNPVSTGMSAYAVNIGEIRSELECYFHMLDPKMMTRAIGDMQPRLLMELPNEIPLEVCFEQPVMSGVSGDFIIDESGSDWRLVEAVGESVASGARADGVAHVNGNEADLNKLVEGSAGLDLGMEGMNDTMTRVNMEKGRRERRGMVAALQDGSVALFELEGADHLDIKMEVEEVKEEGKVANPVGSNGTNKRKDDDRADTGKVETPIQPDFGGAIDNGASGGVVGIGGEDEGSGGGGTGGGEGDGGAEADSDSLTRREEGTRRSKRRRVIVSDGLQNGNA